MSDTAENDPLAGLTYRQRHWVNYYIGASNGNATDAARRAGYKKPRQEGSRLLTNLNIKAAIAATFEESAMGAKEVLARLAAIARSSLADLLFPIEEPTIQAEAGVLQIEGRSLAEDGEDGAGGGIGGPEANPGAPVRYGFDINKAVESGAIHAVKSVKPSKYGLIIELDDRQGALDKIARGLGLYSDAGTAAQEVVVKVYSGVNMEDV